MRREQSLTTLFIFLCMIVSALSVVCISGGADGTRKESAITFSRDVAPIFYRKCADCHRSGESAPFSVLSYNDVRPWARSIKEKVVSRQMPPWHADSRIGQWTNDRRLTEQEIMTISNWVDQGAKRGNPADLPTAPSFPEGWRIGKPDIIFELPEENLLDAAGPDEYQHFDVPTNFTEDKWVQMAEARPGNRSIVHHIAVLMMPRGAPTVAKLSKELRNKAFSAFLENTPFYREGLLMRMKPEAPVYDDGYDIPADLRQQNSSVR